MVSAPWCLVLGPFLALGLSPVPASVSAAGEVQGDIVITYGRSVSRFVPRNRSGNPGQLNSIGFERVYAKRDGQWKFLSHRSVHGPTVAPAGVDPSAPRPRP